MDGARKRLRMMPGGHHACALEISPAPVLQSLHKGSRQAVIDHRHEYDPERALWLPGRRRFFLLGLAAGVGAMLPGRAAWIPPGFTPHGPHFYQLDEYGLWLDPATAKVYISEPGDITSWSPNSWIQRIPAPLPACIRDVDLRWLR